MSEIYIDSDEYKIIKHNNTYRIDFDFPQEELINSLVKTRIINGAISTNHYKSIKFNASSVKRFDELKECLSIEMVAYLLSSLSIQLDYLITSYSKTILGYKPNNIIIINNTKYIFLSGELIVDIDEDEQILISYPFNSKTFFNSPELLDIREIPSFVHYKISYFSLGCIIIYALLLDDEFYVEYLKEKNCKIILNYLNNHPIKNTKIYWLLSRCLVEDPKKRSILLI